MRMGATAARTGSMRNGVSWQIIPRAVGELLADEDRKRAGRVMQAMLQVSKLEIDGLRRAYEGARTS
jgi:predicted 3-demethylubiquinone-9 3-methyltransferase (glyoxalase superfamily)